MFKLTRKALHKCRTFTIWWQNGNLYNHYYYYNNHSSTVCLLVHLSFSTGRLFTLPAAFTVHLLHPFLLPTIPLFISPQTLAFSPGSSGEGGNNYYVNKYACCNHIRATDPIRELIAGGWWSGPVCLSDWPAKVAGGARISRLADWRNESRLVLRCMQSCTLNNALWPGHCISASLTVCLLGCLSMKCAVCVCWSVCLYHDPWLWITYTIHQLIALFWFSSA